MVNNEMRHSWEVTGGLISFTELDKGDNLGIDLERTFFAQAMIKPVPQPKQEVK
jgi:hypothetical protein